jgi:hypothetical protein
LILSVCAVLNTVINETIPEQELIRRREIRSELLKVLRTDFSPAIAIEAIALALKSHLIRSISYATKELDIELQEEILSYVKDLSSITRNSGIDIDDQFTKEIFQLWLETLSNAYLLSAKQNWNTQGLTTSAYMRMSRIFQNTIESISRSILLLRLSVEDEVVLESGEIRMQLARQEVRFLQKEYLVNGRNVIVLSDDIKSILLSSGLSEVDTTLTYYSTNPFYWQSESRYLNGAPIVLQMNIPETGESLEDLFSEMNTTIKVRVDHSQPWPYTSCQVLDIQAQTGWIEGSLCTLVEEESTGDYSTCQCNARVLASFIVSVKMISPPPKDDGVVDLGDMLPPMSVKERFWNSTTFTLLLILFILSVIIMIGALLIWRNKRNKGSTLENLVEETIQRSAITQGNIHQIGIAAPVTFIHDEEVLMDKYDPHSDSEESLKLRKWTVLI